MRMYLCFVKLKYDLGLLFAFCIFPPNLIMSSNRKKIQIFLLLRGLMKSVLSQVPWPLTYYDPATWVILGCLHRPGSCPPLNLHIHVFSPWNLSSPFPKSIFSSIPRPNPYQHQRAVLTAPTSSPCHSKTLPPPLGPLSQFPFVREGLMAVFPLKAWHAVGTQHIYINGYMLPIWSTSKDALVVWKM